MIEIKSGQIWKRKSNGKLVRIGGSRKENNLTEWQLIPLEQGGRTSWKYEGHIKFDLDPVALNEIPY